MCVYELGESQGEVAAFAWELSQGLWMEPGVWVMAPVDSALLVNRQWKGGKGADDWRSRWLAYLGI